MYLSLYKQQENQHFLFWLAQRVFLQALTYHNSGKTQQNYLPHLYTSLGKSAFGCCRFHCVGKKRVWNFSTSGLWRQIMQEQWMKKVSLKNLWGVPFCCGFSCPCWSRTISISQMDKFWFGSREYFGTWWAVKTGIHPGLISNWVTDLCQAAGIELMLKVTPICKTQELLSK